MTRVRVLFLHDAFPGQFGRLAAALAATPGTEVAFATAERAGSLPGVRKAVYRRTRAPDEDGHHYLRWMESAVLTGQAAWRACGDLRRLGFIPDVVCAHSGWGPGLYVKEAFPEARLLGYFEWFYHARGSDADFLAPISEDDACRLRTRNAAILLDLAACDRAVTPTAFQHAQFPARLRPLLTVLHDGIDTEFFSPARADPAGFGLPRDAEVVTYATRGMEPYRGFPQFLRAVARLQRQRPRLHAVVAGSDKVFYGRRPADGVGYGRRMLAELPGLDRARLHFVGPLPYTRYRDLLRASGAHVYLTAPFVLSWSALEAMATGCLLIGSDTAPVREVIADGVNGLLTDFHDDMALAERIALALDLAPRNAQALRAAARATVTGRYALKDLLPRQVALVRELAGGVTPPASG